MPREKVEWFVKQSVHDSDKIHARQSCTYYSIINVNKTNNPYSSSFEKEQTWTLSRTISNNNKRYQSSIDNIHLTIPLSSLKTNQSNYENVHFKKDRSVSFLPTPKYSSALYSSSTVNTNSVTPLDSKQHKTILPIKITKNNCSNLKLKPSLKNSSLTSTRSMRTIPAGTDFIVRI